LPISASCWHAGALWLRLSGADSAVRAARAGIGGDEIDAKAAQAAWSAMRDQTVPFFAQVPRGRLWRLSLPATAPLDFGGTPPAANDLLIEWNGALRWLRSDAPPETIRALATKLGGHATLWRGDRAGAAMFHPLAPAVFELHQRLKREFDPHGIFNRNRL